RAAGRDSVSHIATVIRRRVVIDCVRGVARRDFLRIEEELLWAREAVAHVKLENGLLAQCLQIKKLTAREAAHSPHTGRNGLIQLFDACQELGMPRNASE